jgi:endonuclease/exonuclease/phosphatase family metal-dependent hydrolase
VRVRVLCYNVHGFRSGIEPLATVVESDEPDVVLVQEYGFHLPLRRFARRLGMRLVSRHRLLRPVQRNAVLVGEGWRVTGAEQRDLSGEPPRRRRGFMVADLRRMGAPFSVVSVHLGLGGERQALVHARELTDFVAGLNRPVVLGGDFNQLPESSAVRWVAERLFDSFPGDQRADLTFPARDPTARIDFLFVNDRAKVQKAWIGSGPDVAVASDHRPIVADLEIEEALP